MTFVSPHAFKPFQVLALAATLSFSMAYADEYTDVSQLVRNGKYAEALNKADVYLVAKPRDPQMRFLKGVIQRDAGKTTDAIATFSRLTEDYPELPEPYNNLAVLYAGQSQFDKARTALEMAIRTNPSYATAQENLGDVYARMASQAYNKALQIDTGSAAVPPKLAMINDLNPTSTSAAPSGSAKPATPLPMPAATATSTSTTVAAATTTPVPVPVPAPAPATTIAPAVAPTPAAPSAAPAPVVKPAPAPAPAVAAAIAGNSAAQKSVEHSVQAWASAWEAKDMGAYLGAYDKNFTPPNKATRKVWEKERHARIVGKNTIVVKISDLAISIKDGQATARFRQDYSAGKFKASSRKTLELVKSGDRWLIVSEATGG